ncbi:MAG: aspartate aminotransferase family protein [Chloroflexi bacterium]|nr:aspartate aminotransferase family protein [Chloroflexota bacterium]
MGKITNVKDRLPGPESQRLMAISQQYEARVQGYQAPLVWDHAEGVVVSDVDGNRYIDWTSGVLVTNVGHCHPKLVHAIQEAATKLLNCYEFPTEPRVMLAKRMVEITPPHLDRAFFLTTGSDATEAAMRVVKRHTGRYEIISFYGGFHGRTAEARSAGGLGGVRRGFGPTVPGFIHVPYPYCYRCPFKARPETCGLLCLDYLDTTVHCLSTGSLAGIIVEPYQGSAGFIFPPAGYLKRLEEWVRAQDLVFVLDEVQSSFGRTGKFFAMEWEGLTPDLVCIGKGIGSGMPISALMATSEVLTGLKSGDLGSTLGGSPFSCAAALAVIEIMQEEKLVENAARIGAILQQGLRDIMEHSRYLGDVRGQGMVAGLEFVTDKATREPAPDITVRVISEAAQNGVIVGKVGMYGSVIRVAPPLVMNEEEAHESLEIMEKVILSL